MAGKVIPFGKRLVSPAKQLDREETAATSMTDRMTLDTSGLPRVLSAIGQDLMGLAVGSEKKELEQAYIFLQMQGFLVSLRGGSTSTETQAIRAEIAKGMQDDVLLGVLLASDKKKWQQRPSYYQALLDEYTARQARKAKKKK